MQAYGFSLVSVAGVNEYTVNEVANETTHANDHGAVDAPIE